MNQIDTTRHTPTRRRQQATADETSPRLVNRLSQNPLSTTRTCNKLRLVNWLTD